MSNERRCYKRSTLAVAIFACLAGCSPSHDGTQGGAAAASAPAAAAVERLTPIQTLQAQVAKRYPREISLGRPTLRRSGEEWATRDYEGAPNVVEAFQRAEAALASAPGGAADVAPKDVARVLRGIRQEQSAIASEMIARTLTGKAAEAASEYQREWRAGAITERSVLAWLASGEEMPAAAFAQGLASVTHGADAALEHNAWTLLAKLSMVAPSSRPVLSAGVAKGTTTRVVDMGERAPPSGPVRSGSPDLVHVVEAAAAEVDAYVKRASDFSTGAKGEFESSEEYAARVKAASAAADEAAKRLTPELQQMFTVAMARTLAARYSWSFDGLAYDADKEMFTGSFRLESANRHSGEAAQIDVRFSAPRAEAPAIKEDMLKTRPQFVWSAPQGGTLRLVSAALHGTNYTVAAALDHDTGVQLSAAGRQEDMALYNAAQKQRAEAEAAEHERQRQAAEKAAERAAKERAAAGGDESTTVTPPSRQSGPEKLDRWARQIEAGPNAYCSGIANQLRTIGRLRGHTSPEVGRLLDDAVRWRCIPG